jgi:predicted nuclease of predicted toxin-antitoxin system
MRFKLDENLPREAAKLLAEAGYEAITVTEQGLAGAADEAIHSACLQEKRVLVTLDVGFADIRRYPTKEHSGIIVLRPQSQDRKRIISAIENVLKMLTAEIVEGHLWVVEETRIRIR